jgi:hypothetical protein
MEVHLAEQRSYYTVKTVSGFPVGKVNIKIIFGRPNVMKTIEHFSTLFSEF